MDNLRIKHATIDDIPFLVDTIIEAEKSGTDKLSYSTIFGLSEAEVREYLTAILKEEVDGCELSLSSFMIAEHNGKVISALSSWVEAKDGIPSSIIKGNLLNFILPKESVKHAIKVNRIISEINIEYIPNTIIIGAGFVYPEFRGFGLGPMLIRNQIEFLSKSNSGLKEAYVQIFETNAPSIRSVEKLGFVVVSRVESSNQEILNYLPSNRKVLMRIDITQKS